MKFPKIEIKQRQISLGDPFSLGGSTYVVRSQNDLLQMAVDFEYLRLYKQGLIVTPRLHELIVERVQLEFLVLRSKLSSLGVPQKLRQLFDIKRKSDAEKYCRNLQLSEFELFLLIHNCDQIDFQHLPKFRKHIPSELEMPNDYIHKEKTLKFIKKMVALLKFRKNSHIHLFERDNEWHVFYFTHEDFHEEGKGHYQDGPHIHYISHLWMRRSTDQILASFDQRRTKFSGYHIDFVQFKHSDLTSRRNVPVTVLGEQPMLLVVNHNIPNDPIVDPIPFAHLTTRGEWISSISFIPNNHVHTY